jgi:hypothetical protein
MTTARMVGVLLGLAMVGVAVVAIRVDQSRVSSRVQNLQFKQTELAREIGRQEMQMAQLRSPQAIRGQAERLGLEVAPKAAAQVTPAKRKSAAPTRKSD